MGKGTAQDRAALLLLGHHKVRATVYTLTQTRPKNGHYRITNSARNATHACVANPSHLPSLSPPPLTSGPDSNTETRDA